MPKIFLWLDGEGEQKASFTKPGGETAMFVVEYDEGERPTIYDADDTEIGVDN
jgi:hypothetical protein